MTNSCFQLVKFRTIVLLDSSSILGEDIFVTLGHTRFDISPPTSRKKKFAAWNYSCGVIKINLTWLHVCFVPPMSIEIMVKHLSIDLQVPSNWRMSSYFYQLNLMYIRNSHLIANSFSTFAVKNLLNKRS